MLGAHDPARSAGSGRPHGAARISTSRKRRTRPLVDVAAQADQQVARPHEPPEAAGPALLERRAVHGGGEAARLDANGEHVRVLDLRFDGGAERRLEMAARSRPRVPRARCASRGTRSSPCPSRRDGRTPGRPGSSRSCSRRARAVPAPRSPHPRGRPTRAAGRASPRTPEERAVGIEVPLAQLGAPAGEVLGGGQEGHPAPRRRGAAPAPGPRPGPPMARASRADGSFLAAAR